MPRCFLPYLVLVCFGWLASRLAKRVMHLLYEFAYFYFMALSVARLPLADNGVSFTLKTSVEWDLECVDFYFWQGTMRRNNALLQRIATQQNLTSGVL